MTSLGQKSPSDIKEEVIKIYNELLESKLEVGFKVIVNDCKVLTERHLREVMEADLDLSELDAVMIDAEGDPIRVKAGLEALERKYGIKNMPEIFNCLSVEAKKENVKVGDVVIYFDPLTATFLSLYVCIEEDLFITSGYHFEAGKLETTTWDEIPNKLVICRPK